ncbi:hypothetical protein N836_04970 [Leptolyngbya sp. Heron Island J]|nr:hypothetical protein N836_04970 [Leptolyngbya sp. Heron Island J]
MTVFRVECLTNAIQMDNRRLELIMQFCKVAEIKQPQMYLTEHL